MDENTKQELTWLGSRMTEKSTYAGLAFLGTGIFHLTGADAATLTQIITDFGMAFGGVILFVLREKAA